MNGVDGAGMKQSATVLPFAGNPKPRQALEEPARVLILPVTHIESADDMEASPRRRRSRRSKKDKQAAVLAELSLVNHSNRAPARPFLASALEEMREKIIADVQRMIAESFGLPTDDLKGRR